MKGIIIATCLIAMTVAALGSEVDAEDTNAELAERFELLLQDERYLGKRGIFDILNPINACKVGGKYVIQFCYSLAADKMGELVAFMKEQISGSLGKREVDHYNDKRGVTDAFNWALDKAGSAACVYILKWFASLAGQALKSAMISFVKAAILSAIG